MAHGPGPGTDVEEPHGTAAYAGIEVSGAVIGGTHERVPPAKTVLRHAYRRVPENARLAMYRRMPDPLWAKLHRADGYGPAPLDVTPLRRIESEPLERLRDADYLTNELLPAMGLSTHAAPTLFPTHLHGRVGRGVQAIQFPNQLGPYLAMLTGAGVKTYLELGVERGGTFAITVEVLRRFGLDRAIAVDLNRPLILDQWHRPEVEFHQLDSFSEPFAELVRERGPFDLALIDADHSEAAVRNDFEVLRPHARMLAFHDITQEDWCPDVGLVWRDIVSRHAGEYDFHEFTAYYPDYNPLGRLGLGLAIRRD